MGSGEWIHNPAIQEAHRPTNWCTQTRHKSFRQPKRKCRLRVSLRLVRHRVALFLDKSQDLCVLISILDCGKVAAEALAFEPVVTVTASASTRLRDVKNRVGHIQAQA
eukprot:1275595-Rhodomonas_salina.2